LVDAGGGRLPRAALTATYRLADAAQRGFNDTNGGGGDFGNARGKVTGT
jgi:hypothetical protein